MDKCEILYQLLVKTWEKSMFPNILTDVFVLYDEALLFEKKYPRKPFPDVMTFAA